MSSLPYLEELPSFDEAVYEIVRCIPRGYVCPYGEIARLMGRPGCARRVGNAMKHTPPGRDIPAWRVVCANGRIAPGWLRQRELLKEEGVRFRSPTCVDMKRHLWTPEEE